MVITPLKILVSGVIILIVIIVLILWLSGVFGKTKKSKVPPISPPTPSPHSIWSPPQSIRSPPVSIDHKKKEFGEWINDTTWKRDEICIPYYSVESNVQYLIFEGLKKFKKFTINWDPKYKYIKIDGFKSSTNLELIDGKKDELKFKSPSYSQGTVDYKYIIKLNPSQNTGSQDLLVIYAKADQGRNSDSPPSFSSLQGSKDWCNTCCNTNTRGSDDLNVGCENKCKIDILQTPPNMSETSWTPFVSFTQIQK